MLKSVFPKQEVNSTCTRGNSSYALPTSDLHQNKDVVIRCCTTVSSCKGRRGLVCANITSCEHVKQLISGGLRDFKCTGLSGPAEEITGAGGMSRGGSHLAHFCDNPVGRRKKI